MENSCSGPEVRIAIRSGNFDSVKKLVKKDGDVNQQDDRGWTLLHEAAVNDKLKDIARFLISAGAIVDYKTKTGMTPFYIACRYGCEAIAKMLIETGCDINVHVAEDNIDDDDETWFKEGSLTPLHVACYQGNLAILKLLLENNANVNAKDQLKQTAVDIAIKVSNADAFHMLIEAGACLTMMDYWGYKPLPASCMSGEIEIFNILFKYLDSFRPFIKHKGRNGMTLLMTACSIRNYYIAKKLFECGADTSVTNNRRIALYEAVFGKLDLIKLLLLNTPNKVIEKCFSFKRGSDSYYSLPCILIDTENFEGLKLLYQSDVSEAVLKCPSVITTNERYLISPIGHLLLFKRFWLDNENKLKFLEFLLSYKFLINPVYGEFNPKSTLSLIEVVVERESWIDENWDCGTLLSFILSKVSPYEALPCNLSRQMALFIKAAQYGFVAALDLLRYSDFIEPDDVMEKILEDITDPYYIWTGHEANAIKFLLEKCNTSFMSKVAEIKDSITELIPGDMEKQIAFVSIYNEIDSNLNVVSLKKMCRFTLRKYIRKKANASSQSVRRYVQDICLPHYFFKYLLYQIDF